MLSKAITSCKTAVATSVLCFNIEMFVAVVVNEIFTKFLLVFLYIPLEYANI